MLEIVRVGDDGDHILRAKSRPVDRQIREEYDLFGLICSMFKLMEANKGLGLSAPQVGLDLRFFIMQGDVVVINPKVLIVHSESEIATEGCLSIPGVEVAIARPIKILVEYVDILGRVITEVFADVGARIFLHEYEHLDGILICDYE